MRPASPMMSDGETGKPCEAVFSEEAELQSQAEGCHGTKWSDRALVSSGRTV